jgi:hypothetical protein
MAAADLLFDPLVLPVSTGDGERPTLGAGDDRGSAAYRGAVPGVPDDGGLVERVVRLESPRLAWP